ncbi:MAG TPA: Lrp/AsnC family transcriptional regulator [Thermomicrobiales bacterium]|nr:Lrp/AsnC family transcriptional regulator [Thermomicrobiales bacterium]
MTQIDTIDARILAELQANGRLTMKALAERVGLSSPAMIERVRRLEDRGVIAGYRAVVAPSELGRPLTALISASVDRADYDTFLDRVKDDPGVVECHRVTGDATFVVKVSLADTAALEQLVDDLSGAGAFCTTALVLSSPVPWREIAPPPGSTSQRTRLGRRRRAPAPAAVPEHGTNESGPARPQTPRRPGRPRGRRTSSS